MNTNIQIFTSDVFGEIRSCLVNNQIMFVGKDVATALGYRNTRKALLDHVDDEDKEDGVTIRDSIGRIQKAVVVNESGLYALILSSKLPQAEAFTKGDVYAARKRMGFEGEPAYVISRWLSKGLIAKSKLEKGKFVKIENEKMVRG